MRFLFTIQYLGTRYAGWQTQKNATGVQQVVEHALNELCGERVRVEAAGRTDSGVHALGQRAHADIPIEISAPGLIRGLSDLLPEDIRAVEAREVESGFHARFNATGKTYVYQIWNQPVANVFRNETHAHVRSPLNVDLMREASRCLLGLHDFKSFTVISPEVSSTRRTIENISVEAGHGVIRITVSANGFLRFMVRRIAGSLIEVGRGGVAPNALQLALEPQHAEARWTAPAAGLTLVSVRYPEWPEDPPFLPFSA